MRGSAIWMRAAVFLKLLLLILIPIMFAKMGWGLIQGKKGDPWPFHWIFLAVAVLETVAWAIARWKPNSP